MSIQKIGNNSTVNFSQKKPIEPLNNETREKYQNNTLMITAGLTGLGILGMASIISSDPHKIIRKSLHR